MRVRFRKNNIQIDKADKTYAKFSLLLFTFVGIIHMILLS